jgi:hypothetical protein
MKKFILIFIIILSCKTESKKIIENENYDYLSYADFGYSSIYDKYFVKTKSCKLINLRKREFEVDVDFSGYIYFSTNHLLNYDRMTKLIKTDKTILYKKYDLWAKIIYNDQFLFDEIKTDFIPDNPCEYYKDNPKYSIYFSKKGDTIWTLIETTKNENRIKEILASEAKKIERYLQEKETQHIKKWHGTYSFGFGRGDTDYTMGFEIDSLGSAEIEDYQGNKTKATIVRATKDTLELKGIENRQYILYKEDGEPGYAIKGHAVYLLNPPSNDYPLTKSKK